MSTSPGHTTLMLYYYRRVVISDFSLFLGTDFGGIVANSLPQYISKDVQVYEF